MKKAGLNPALLYKGAGSGGATTNSGPSAPQGDTNVGAVDLGSALKTGMEIQLLKAQKENIEADTRKKEEEAYNTWENSYSKKLENKINVLLMGGWTTGEGKSVEYHLPNDQDITNSVRFKTKVEELNMSLMQNNKTQNEIDNANALIDKTVKKLEEEITLLHNKGLSEDQILENLKKDGKIKDAEIKWNEVGLKTGDLKYFLIEIFKRIFAPKK